MIIEIADIDLILLIEVALRDSVVLWDDEEYRVLAEKIAERIRNANL